MHELAKEHEVLENYNLHLIPSKKFKTVHFVAKFKAPLSRETITNRALLPYLLHQGTVNHPSEAKLQLKLNNLYGAVLSIDGAKKGDHHVISIRLEVANQRYIQNETTIIQEAIALFNEVIFQPYAPNDAFPSLTFQREKETLQEKIHAVVDNKMEYANMRLIDEMYKGQAYALHVHGYEEDLLGLDEKTAYEYYQKVLAEDQLDIYVLGDFAEKEMEEKIVSTIKREQRKASTEGRQFEEKQVSQNKPQVVIEKQAIQQAKLHLGYRTNSTFKDDDYFALQVCNGILGGFPSSKLFINVREKNSLAYYAASRIESHKGTLLVFSGIAAEDYEQAQKIIDLQMVAMKDGDFSEEELQETKDLIVNQLLETLDNPTGIIELMYQQVIGEKEISPEEFIDQIKQVTKQEVVQVAKKIEKDTVYLLTSEEGDVNA